MQFSHLKPNRWQSLIILILCILSYIVISYFYVKKQKELTLELAEVTNNYALDLLNSKGNIKVKKDSLLIDKVVINSSTQFVDKIKEKTGFGCTIFLQNVRISTTAKAINSSNRSLGTSANSMITKLVYKDGETFIGVTETIGKSWIIVYSPLIDEKLRIIGMIATYREEADFQSDMTFFKTSLCLILGFLCFAVFILIEISIYSNKKIHKSKINLANKNAEIEKSYSKLSISEKKFKDLFDSSYDLIQSIDLNGNFLYVNPAWLETLGYDNNEIYSLNINDIIHEDYTNHCMNIIHQVTNKVRIEGTDVAFVGKTGNIVLLNGNIHCEFENDKPVAIKGIFRNDTDRKLSQQKLKDSEKQYKFLVESANDIIYETDSSGNFIYVNEAVERITGYTAEELIGTNYLSIVVKNQRDQISKFYEEHLKSKAENSTYSFQIHSKSGKKLWIGQNVKTVFNNDSKERVYGYLAVARDITDEKTQQLDVQRQKSLLEEKNKAITQSIHYAKRIQSSILPYEYGLTKLFQKSFILFNPKDIVSGDFYWYSTKGDYKFVAAVDCTGHGVPAAFMSIIGNNQFNAAIKKGLTDPLDILRFVNKTVYKMQNSRTNDSSSRDGMDLAFCAINENKGEIIFCGAKNPLYLIRDNELIKIPGNRVSVGSDIDLTEKDFQSHTIKIKSKDQIYLFSDGYPDQFGGPKDKKFSYSRFRETLMSIHHFNSIEQKEMLNSKLNKWKGKQEQTDDVCLIGIKFD